MAASFRATMLSSDKKIYDADVESLIVPGARGYLGILAHHAPLMTALRPGRVTVREASGKVMTFDLKTAGFFEVARDQATILVD